MCKIIKIALLAMAVVPGLWHAAGASAKVLVDMDMAQGMDVPSQRAVSMEDCIETVRVAYGNLAHARDLDSPDYHDAGGYPDSDGNGESEQIPPHTSIYTVRRPWVPSGQTGERPARRDSLAPDSASVAADSIGSPADSVATDSVSVTKLANTPPHEYISLKTNMLYWAALLPNIGVEWLIDGNWSVALDGNWAQWGSYSHEKSYRLVLLDVEGRRWIKPRAPWHGWYVGLLAGGGWYDLENGTPGHYGWGLMGGVTVGFMWPINRHLTLEAELGAGYMHTRYKDYEPIEGHHVYLRTKELDYFGPIKLNLSLVWRLPHIVKHKSVPAS